MKNYSPVTVLVMGLITQNSMAAEILSPIHVVDKAETQNQAVEAKQEISIKETAEMLRDLVGVSGSRIGGHGIDPSIRGLSQTRLNVLIDGAYVHGGCPNRMDPPTSYAPADNYENITVLKGVQTLEYGGGGPGGTILFERQTERFMPDEKYRADVAAGYRDNGSVTELSADLATGVEQGFARLISSQLDANNYEDGDGNEVRSSFTETNHALILGYTPSNDTRAEFTVEQQRTRDLLYAGAGMDSPKADNDLYRFKYLNEGISDDISQLKFEVYYSDVEHVMDNYTLRTPSNPMMLMRAPSTSETLGGRLVTEMETGIGQFKFGLDIQNNDRDAERINDFNGMLNSVLWPGVSIDQTGIFAELNHVLDNKNNLIMGLRYDRVNAKASLANKDPMGMPLSPNQLYAIYYNGAQAENTDENNVGGLLRYEHAINNGNTYVGISRSVRTADATERYLASNGSTPSMRWVGNPLIDPEKHHQIEAGVYKDHGLWDIDLSVYANFVDDYILRDRFHQPGNNATIYRNVDAELYGFETAVNYQLSDSWDVNFGLGYVYAENTSDDRAIAQIPPLEGNLAFTYNNSDWLTVAKLRFADQQSRVDDDPATGSGLDTGKTPGWAVLDLYASYDMNEAVSVDFGMDNVFDKNYYQHLNRSSAFDPVQVSVNEPGRSIWIKLKADL